MDASHILLALAAGVFGILWYLSIRKVSALRADVASRDEANSTLSRRLFESGTAQQRLEQRLGEARHLCESQERAQGGPSGRRCDRHRHGREEGRRQTGHQAETRSCRQGSGQEGREEVTRRGRGPDSGGLGIARAAEADRAGGPPPTPRPEALPAHPHTDD